MPEIGLMVTSLFLVMVSNSTRPQRPYNIGIIGISGYGRAHLKLAREAAANDEARLAAVVVPDLLAEVATVAALRAEGCRIYTDYESMLQNEAGRLDLCMIPTGIGWHRRMTEAALRAGMNVLVEKPLAGSVEDARAIIDAERASNRFVAVGFQDLYDPGVWDARSLISTKTLGTVCSVRMLGMWPRPDAYYTRNDWAGRLRTQGFAVNDSPLNNAFAHFLMLSLYFATPEGRFPRAPGNLEAVCLRANQIESFDTTVLKGRTSEGVAVWFGATHASEHAREPEIIVEGSAGRLRWLHEREYVIERPGCLPVSVPLRGVEHVRTGMMQAVLRRLQDEYEPICTTQMALAQVETIARMHMCASVFDCDPALLERESEKTGQAPRVFVRGLESALRTAFTNATLDPVAKIGAH